MVTTQQDPEPEAPERKSLTKTATGKFLVWLMGLTTMMRYFVLAVLFHVLILFVLGSIKIVSETVKVIARFGSDSPLPPPPEDIDPFAAFRGVEYTGPTMGDGVGTMGKGPGGIPTSAGVTPTDYRPTPVRIEANAADSAAAEVIGVASDSSTIMARVQDGIASGMAPPTVGFGEGKVGTSGVRGPGGGGLAHIGGRVGPMKSQLISKFKGSQEAEKAVMAALRWLKEHQEEDGSWGPLNTDAMSALAVLCFLGHGETPNSDEFGLTLSRGLVYLTTLIGPDGMVKSGKMHSQGVVMYALSEGYMMTASPQIRDPLERAIKATLEAQEPKGGGWRYAAGTPSVDTAVTGWVVMGLASAKIAGLSVATEPYELAAQYLWNAYLQADNGSFNLSPEQRYNTLSIGVLCQQLLGQGNDKRLKKALDYFKGQKVDWEHPGIGNLYGWYYATQAMFQSGGEYWIHWNKEMRDTLVKSQAADGHWEQPGREVVGLSNGPVFSTTLCCLMLEVYYRYLPLYREMEKNSTTPTPTPPST